MLIVNSKSIPSSEITSESNYFSRSKFITGIAAAGAAIAASLNLRDAFSHGDIVEASSQLAALSRADTVRMRNPTSWKDITNYNNYYEFGTDKYSPGGLANGFRTRPWTVSIEGLVKKAEKAEY